MKIYIKNMVCNRCVFVVEKLIKDMKLSPLSVEMGEVDFGETHLSNTQMTAFRDNLNQFGFEILDDKNAKLIDKIKRYIIDFINNHLKDVEKLNLSNYLSRKLKYDYSYLSNIFSEIAGITIEQYVIQLKIEKAKELLFYNELTLSEISYQLNYSSVAHLSSQFKKVTGMTPTKFKQIKDVQKRVSLDKL